MFIRIEAMDTVDPPEAMVIKRGLLSDMMTDFSDLPLQFSTLVLRDEHDDVVGGLQSRLMLQWLEVEYLWIADTIRRQGWGGTLLDRAERAARAQDALGSYLMTSTFQAVGFYTRRGYSELGRLHDRPRGNDRLWLAKRFD